MALQARPDAQIQPPEQVLKVAVRRAAERAASFPPCSPFHLGKDAQGRWTEKLDEVVLASPTMVMFEYIFGPVHLHSTLEEAISNYCKLQQALQLIWQRKRWGEYMAESKRDIFKLRMHLNELAFKPYLLSEALRNTP